MKITDHNKKTVLLLDDTTIECKCGGKLRVVGKENPGRNYGVCDKCMQEFIYYVATEAQVDRRNNG